MNLMKFQYMKSGKNQFHYIHNEVAKREIKKLYIQYILYYLKFINFTLQAYL